ncbi:MAG: preprotein translocase subunit SecY [Planctomycetes bacterium]|nr:preprotein translocase subunit SecY [Planctomycetota bacterium]
MFEKVRVIFTIPELRQKIFLTLLFLAIYRVGSHVPLLIVDPVKMKDFFQSDSGGLGKMLETVATFAATDLDNATIFGLGIMPYISASIIFQLLGTVWKPLEELQKEGESGRKKINEYTRYLTVFLCLGQSLWYVNFLVGDGAPGKTMIRPQFLDGEHLRLSWYFFAVITMTAGTIFLMWLGEQIDEFGIGNGISLLIMAGILARMPSVWIGKIIKPLITEGLQLGTSGQMGIEVLLVLIVLFVAVVVGVVFITQGQRRIPTQSAKHVRGRRVYGGNRQFLPLRVNQAGVMPIIFASSLLMFPTMLFKWMAANWGTKLNNMLADAFSSYTSWTHNILYVAMIFFFCYFWTAISFNPKDVSENLKSYGAFIPGYRPGKRTADYLEKVMVRITYVGAGFLSLVAIAPMLVSSSFPMVDAQMASFYGGTSLLIAVSVAFDLVQKIDSHLVMRNYRGLLEKA